MFLVGMALQSWFQSYNFLSFLFRHSDYSCIKISNGKHKTAVFQENGFVFFSCKCCSFFKKKMVILQQQLTFYYKHLCIELLSYSRNIQNTFSPGKIFKHFFW